MHSFTQQYTVVISSSCMRGLVCKFHDCLHVRGHASKPENHFSALLSEQDCPSLNTHTHTHARTHTKSCPRVLSRLELALGEPVQSDTPRLHQPLTRIAVSFKSHASFSYCSIQTDSRTLRYFFYISCEYLSLTQ